MGFLWLEQTASRQQGLKSMPRPSPKIRESGSQSCGMDPHLSLRTQRRRGNLSLSCICPTPPPRSAFPWPPASKREPTATRGETEIQAKPGGWRHSKVAIFDTGLSAEGSTGLSLPGEHNPLARSSHMRRQLSPGPDSKGYVHKHMHVHVGPCTQLQR